MLDMRNIFYYLPVILFFFSCEEESPPVPEQEVLLQRTIIAYLCGDNSLSSEIDTKIDALQQGMQLVDAADNRLIVYTDCRDEMPKLLQITAAEILVLEEYAEKNSASAANFSQILQKIMQDFPAESYGLICFSHASGWLPQGALNNPSGFAGTYPPASALALRSIFEDEGQEMPLTEFAAAIPLTPAGDKLEFILFETCYMAGVEVAYELRNKTKYIVSSAAEMLSPGFVEIYPAHLSGLFAPVPLLKSFATAYFDYWNAQTGTARSATISLINLLQIEELANIVKTIYADNKELDISSIQHFNRNSYHLFFDLSDQVYALATQEQKDNYDHILSQIIEYQAATPQFMPGYLHSFIIRRHCGLTTYIKQELFSDLNHEYDKLSWNLAVN
jgi:hypothetical protein